MSTNRKRANQQNAKQSTGPISVAGKKAVQRNALKHGLRAKDVVVLDENAADFEALRASLYETLKPADALQEALVERIAVSLWRLRRIPSLEAGILEYQSLANRLQEVDQEISLDRFREREQEAAIRYSLPLPDILRPVPPELMRRRTAIVNKMDNGLSRLGKMFCRDAKTHDALGKLTRYESQISRELYRALSQFERLQTISLLPIAEE